MNGRQNRSAEVLVVGAGPVGLATATELASRKVDVLVVERSERSALLQPRAKLLNVRSMTLLRRWGLVDAVKSAAPLGRDSPGDVAFVTELTGFEIARFSNALMTRQVPDDAAPETALIIPQGEFENVLLDNLRENFDVEVLTGTALTDLEQDSSGVDVRCRATDGAETVVRAQWVVGCDGSRSDVRQLVGIELSGKPAIARNLGVVFRSDTLTMLNPQQDATQYWIVHPNWPGIMGRLDLEGVWWAQITGLESDFDVRTLDLVKYVRGMAGVPDLEVEIMDTATWTARQLLADVYRRQRVLIAGDAAHLHPPMGGYGMNTGLGDAVDLGWRLAAVLQGWGGGSLLDSYGSERRSVHQRVLRESVDNYGRLSRDFAEPVLSADTPMGARARARVGNAITATKTREFRSLGVQLGCVYANSPNIVAPAEGLENSATTYIPRSTAGHLAPHIWIADAALYDLLGPGITALTTIGSPQRPARTTTELIGAAETTGIPLTIVALPAEARVLYPEDYTLVRPDQFIAYSGSAPCAGWLDVLRRITATDNEVRQPV
ncbi:FAD-dependent monooxygenase [Nocardia sp. NPDC001965]